MRGGSRQGPKAGPSSGDGLVLIYFFSRIVRPVT